MKKRRRRRLRFTESQQKYMIMLGVMALLAVVAIVSMLQGKTPAQFPFGHVYQAARTQPHTGEDTPIFYLTADGHLLLESRDRATFSDEGRMEPEEEGWTAAPRGNVTRRWRLRLEGETQPVLTLTEKGETTVYTLSRVDNLTCAAGETSAPLQWFAPGVYDSGSFDLPAFPAEEGRELTFLPEDSTLTALEVTDPSGETHTLTAPFSLPARSGVYRAALDGGEYLLLVEAE